MFEAIGTQGTIAIIATLASVFVLTLLGTTISKFFRRCGADEALVRTGQGGNRVVLGGGVMVYPVLHQLLRVSLRSVKLSVERAGKNALVTADKIKANVATELYVKVEPIAEDVLSAARSFGERNLDQDVIAELIEGKLTDALRSVAANQTFMSLHGKRKEFAEQIQVVLAEELKKNGLTLENVSITSLSMLSVTDLDPSDVFDAEGLRAITESVTTNREKTNQIQREKENLIHGQNVTAKMRQLELDQAQQQAEADQSRRVKEYAALQASETARAVFTHEQAKEMAGYEKQAMVEKARITQEQEIAVAGSQRQLAEREAQIAMERAAAGAEIAKGREIRVAEIERQKVLEAEAYEEITDRTFESFKHADEINRQLTHLARLDNFDWQPPAIEVIARRRNEPDFILRFLSDLERLAYGLFLMRNDPSDRIRRYGKLLGEIQTGDDLFGDTSQLQLSDGEKKAVRKSLDGDIYSVTRIRLPLLLRLDELLSGGSAVYNSPIVSVEHVLPQNPSVGSQWLADFPNENDRGEWVHRLANLVLLTRRKNSQASNYDFVEKK